MTFKDKDQVEKVVKENAERLSMFEAWMKANTEYRQGRTLTYAEFPGHFVYDTQEQRWLPRQ